MVAEHLCNWNVVKALLVDGYLAGREQETVCNIITLVREQFVSGSTAVLARLPQSQQVNVDALAHDVLHHNLSLPGSSTPEQFPETIILQAKRDRN